MNRAFVNSHMELSSSNPVENMSRYFTERQVAQYTGLSVHTLRAHRFKKCGISYIKVGRSVRYKLEDVETFMKAHRITPNE